jgi:zinc transport system substrate-binding protein
MARWVARILSREDPPNASRYQANLKTVLTRIAGADRRATEMLVPIKGRPFIVFHDAYQYFEKRYGLAGRGAATLEGRNPGARRISRIRREIRNHPISCVLTEPQYAPRLAQMLANGTSAKVGKVDPLGSTLKAGKGAYARLILSVAAGVTRCLK